MKAHLPFIESKFEEFNKLIFGGALPKVPIKLSHAKRSLGACAYKKRVMPGGRVENYDFRLRINASIELDERELEDVLIHEMIHYYIALHQIKDSSAHGKVFQRIMNEVNAKYDRKITISHKLSPERHKEASIRRKGYQVIAVVFFADSEGHTAVKVLPRIAERILYYYSRVSSLKEVKQVQLYLSDDPFFNRFPKSSALNAIKVKYQELAIHLQDARKLIIRGTTIVQSS